MEYPYFKGLEADRYSFYRVPKALVKADLFQKMSGDAKLLYAVLLDRMSLSIKNGWQDKHGNAYIICTIEEVMDSIHCARQKAVKLLDELEQEFQLIERRRQGLGKPNLLYVKDLYAGLSQSNYWKYENHTSGSLKNELPGVLKSNGSNTEKINKTDNSETHLCSSITATINRRGGISFLSAYRKMVRWWALLSAADLWRGGWTMAIRWKSTVCVRMERRTPAASCMRRHTVRHGPWATTK